MYVSQKDACRNKKKGHTSHQARAEPSQIKWGRKKGRPGEPCWDGLLCSTGHGAWSEL